SSLQPLPDLKVQNIPLFYTFHNPPSDRQAMLNFLQKKYPRQLFFYHQYDIYLSFSASSGLHILHPADMPEKTSHLDSFYGLYWLQYNPFGQNRTTEESEIQAAALSIHFPE